MEQTFGNTSLVPYIESRHGGFYLEIAANGKELRTDQEFPFQLMDAPGPLSRLVRAKIKTDQGVTIEPVFLLVQNDDVPPIGDGLTPINNTEIEALWQQTYSVYFQGEKSDNGFIPFPGMEEHIPCFKPLFFCKTKQLFFHPPCPVCGNELTLCRDDKKLAHAALDQFSTSSQRYLVCDNCPGADGGTTFYKWSRNSFDRVFVKDRFDLISDFKKLRTPGSPTCFFPCTTCPLHSECHILDNKAKERIVFFSFYPFHMLLFKACSLNAVNFLKISAGAPEKIQNSRLQDSPVFFFKGDKRFFLEILFIKLSFLDQVLEILTKRVSQTMWSGTGLSAQSLWIEPIKGTTPLPWLWNFRVSMIDVLEIKPGRICTKNFSAHTFFNFYSALWFQALAVNKNQNLEKVINEIDKDSDALLSPVLAMEQIFWNPEQFHASEIYGQFWTQALALGQEMRFFQKKYPLDQEITNFSQKIRTLREKIKETLFSTSQIVPMEKTEEKSSSQAGCTGQTEPAGNMVLVQMLNSILQRWPTEEIKIAPPPQPLWKPGKDDLDNTVELATAIAKKDRATRIQGEMENTIENNMGNNMDGMDGDDDILETITLSSSLSQTSQGFNEPEEPDIFSSPVPEKDKDENQKPHENYEDMDKTMVLTPGNPEPEKTHTGVPPLNKDVPDTTWEDSLDKTMVMAIPGRSPDPDSYKNPPPGTLPPGDKGFETLEETIVITPDKHKPGNRP